jgi:hypothetical protein
MAQPNIHNLPQVADHGIGRTITAEKAEYGAQETVGTPLAHRIICAAKFSTARAFTEWNNFYFNQ